MYRVEWYVTALEDLLRIAEPRSDAARQQLAAAVRAMNQALRADPFAVGEGRETDEERVVFTPPLGVSVMVNVVDRVVRIDSVWCFGHLEQ